MSATGKFIRKIAEVWPVQSVPDGVQAFKKNILLYPGSEPMSHYDPWLIGAEDWIQKPGGFEPHPHRGFETITIMLEGSLRHTDESRGRKGITAVVSEGDVQWMTTGRGIIHSEMPEGDGVAHVLQIWLNLPIKDKMVEPSHQDLRAADIPVAVATNPSGEETARVRVISGEYDGLKGPARTFFPVLLLDMNLKGAAREDLLVDIPPGHRGFVYVLEGAAAIGGTLVNGGHCAWLSDELSDKDGSTLAVAQVAAGETRVFLFAGTPHKEPVVSRGPFVVSSKAELEAAFSDYRAGKF